MFRIATKDKLLDGNFQEFSQWKHSLAKVTTIAFFCAPYYQTQLTEVLQIINGVICDVYGGGEGSSFPPIISDEYFVRSLYGREGVYVLESQQLQPEHFILVAIIGNASGEINHFPLNLGMDLSNNLCLILPQNAYNAEGLDKVVGKFWSFKDGQPPRGLEKYTIFENLPRLFIYVPGWTQQDESGQYGFKLGKTIFQEEVNLNQKKCR